MSDDVWRAILLGLLFVAMLLGLAIGDEYGMSADEPDNAYVGGVALRAYRSPSAHAEYLLRGDEIAHHGPSYFMLWEAASRTIIKLIPSWHITDAHHFVNYLTFLLGLAFIYRFTRRFLARSSALIIAIFAGTQPLLLGHAFINQKDTPFWVFLLGSIMVGLWAVDRLLESTSSALRPDPGAGLLGRLRREWSSADPRMKWVGCGLLIIGVLISLDMLVFDRGVLAAEWIIRRAHAREAWPLINDLYRHFAEDADKVAVDVYLDKLQWPYWILRAPLVGIGTLLGAVGFRLSFPGAFRQIRQTHGANILRFTGAGALLGWTMSIRPIGLFAAGLVGIYWLLKRQLRGVGLLLPYGLAAGLTTYLTWPYLWPAPCERFIQTLLFTGSLPLDTLYWGRVISADSLPWHYFPSYLATELTEPATPLILLGLAMAVWRSVKFEEDRATLGTVLAWIFVPLAGFIMVGGGVYGNIRHLLFIVIPLVMLAGLSLNQGMRWLRSKSLSVVLFAGLLIPGLVGIIRLHPYQYTYFNSYIGGVENAAHLHILERWCTSYREAMTYVNAHAKLGAVVGSMREEDVARPFARSDLSFPSWSKRLAEDADYLLTCGFQLGAFGDDPRWIKVYQVERAGATFAEVLVRTPGASK